MPPKYLIIRKVFGTTEVVFYNSDKQTRHTMFVGCRWPARRFLREIRSTPTFQGVPAFCEKYAPKGCAPRVVEVPLGQL